MKNEKLRLDNSSEYKKIYIKVRFSGYDIDLNKYVTGYYKVQELLYNTFSVDKSSYITGETLKFSYDFSDIGYEITYLYVYLRLGANNNGYRKTLYKYELGDSSALKDKNLIQFQIPNDDRVIGDKVFVEVKIYGKDIDSETLTTDFFTISQNTNISSELFGSIKDIFTVQYNAFPANSTHQKTENEIYKAIIDDNGLVHLVISQIAWWWGVKSNGSHESSMSRHFQYYYMTYNPNTEQKSTPQKIFESKMLNDGNLPSKKIDLFSIHNGKGYLITSDSSSYEKRLYLVNTNQANSEVISNAPEEFGYSRELISKDNALYYFYTKYEVAYRSDGDLIRDKEITNRVIKIYDNGSMSQPYNLSENYIDSKFRIYNDKISYYRKGEFYKLDSDMKIMESSKDIMDSQAKYLLGIVNIYDSTAKELLLDENYNVVLLNQNNSKEILFNISDSENSARNSSYQKIVASIYQDKVIVAYEMAEYPKQYKVVIFNRYTKSTDSTILGNKINGGSQTYSEISMNSNKKIVIANIDGDYDKSSQLVMGEVETNIQIETDPPKSEKETLLNETHNLAFGYYKDETNQRWYISPVKSSEKVTVYSLMPIKNGSAGWGVVGENVAKIDLDTEQVTIDNISDSSDNRYSIKYSDSTLNETITSDKIQPDIEKIRNTTINIKWWFFETDDNWYIVNKNGNLYRFASKDGEESSGKTGTDSEEEYDWQEVDLGNPKPTFSVTDGIKKFKF